MFDKKASREKTWGAKGINHSEYENAADFATKVEKRTRRPLLENPAKTIALIAAALGVLAGALFAGSKLRKRYYTTHTPDRFRAYEGYSSDDDILNPSFREGGSPMPGMHNATVPRPERPEQDAAAYEQERRNVTRNPGSPAPSTRSPKASTSNPSTGSKKDLSSTQNRYEHGSYKFPQPGETKKTGTNDEPIGGGD